LIGFTLKDSEITAEENERNENMTAKWETIKKITQTFYNFKRP